MARKYTPRPLMTEEEIMDYLYKELMFNLGNVAAQISFDLKLADIPEEDKPRIRKTAREITERIKDDLLRFF